MRDEMILSAGAQNTFLKVEHPVALWNNGAVAYTPGSITTHKAGEMRYEISNYLGNVNAVVNDRKTPRSGFVRSAFSLIGDGTGWAGTNSAVAVTGGYLRVVPSTSSNDAFKAFTTVDNKRYILRLRTDRGSGSDLKVAITGVAGTTTLLNTQQNTILFTAPSGGSTTITISQITGSTAVYWIDQLELAEDHIYEATVLMTGDYYPFGMQMPGRNTNLSTYRFGYNGMEMDNEAKGNGNSYTTEFRQYDPRLGRWLSLDPLMMQFPDMSPYIAFDDNPVYYVDPYGLAAEGGPGDPPPGGGDKLTKEEQELLDKKNANGGTDIGDVVITPKKYTLTVTVEKSKKTEKESLFMKVLNYWEKKLFGSGGNPKTEAYFGVELNTLIKNQLVTQKMFPK